MANLDNVVMFSNVRLSFPHLSQPQKRQNGGESYNAAFLITPNDPNFQKFMQVVTSMTMVKWQDQAQATLQMIQGDRKKRCYSQGEEHVNQKTMKPYDGYQGHLVIAAGRVAPARPQAIDSTGSPVDPDNTMAYQTETRKMYGGCRVNVALKPWLQQNEHGRAVRCDLVSIQFFRDDTPFGEGVTDASALFTPVAATEAPAGSVPPWMQQAPQAAPAAPQQPWGGVVAPAAMPWAAQAPQGMPPAPFPAPGVPQFGQ